MDNRYFRQPKVIHRVVQTLASFKEPVKIMEVCGTHTMAIGQWGIRKLLPDNIKLISGPGCPVCVTPSSVIDTLTGIKNVTIATFGDLLRVPGSSGTLEQARAAGLDVRTVYSPMEALEFAKEKETIFVGIGFETTIPGIAYTILEAKKLSITGFSVLALFKLIPPALEALLIDRDVDIDGFILPGHVSVVIGSDSYGFLPQKYNVSGVVAGFEPYDIVSAIKALVEHLHKPQIINQYSRVVTPQGNVNAQEVINKVTYVRDSYWRGLGWIPNSGLAIREEFSRFDAEKRYPFFRDLVCTELKSDYAETGSCTCPQVDFRDVEVKQGCRCGDVLKGKITPFQCPLFAKKCTPEQPIGPCMVSSEGSCSAFYLYEKDGVIHK